MPPDSPPPSGRVSRFFKRVTHGVKKALEPGDRASASRATTASPQAPPGALIPQPAPSRAPTPALPPTSPAGSQQAPVSPQPAPSPSQPAPTNSPSAGNSGLTLAAKNAGANARSGLKTALQALKDCSAAFPPLQAAVGEVLTMVNVVEVGGLIPHALECYSFGCGNRPPPRIGRITKG